MQKQELGVAVVGSGRIGTLRANMVTRHPSVRFLAVSDIDPERAGLLGQQVNADLTSSDNYRIISDPQVNTVIVSTPEHEHVEPILQALELGKPVFVEKPLALTLEDTDRIVEAVDRTGVELRIGYSRRHDRRWMLAKEQLAQGRLGEVMGIQSRVYNSRAHMMEILKRSPEATPVLDSLTYYVDMACWYLDDVRPVEVVARGKFGLYKEMGHDIHDVTWAIITFENGCLVNLGICYTLPARHPSYGQSAPFRGAGRGRRDGSGHGQQGQLPVHRQGRSPRLRTRPLRRCPVHAEQLLRRLGHGRILGAHRQRNPLLAGPPGRRNPLLPYHGAGGKAHGGGDLGHRGGGAHRQDGQAVRSVLDGQVGSGREGRFGDEVGAHSCAPLRIRVACSVNSVLYPRCLSERSAVVIPRRVGESQL